MDDNNLLKRDWAIVAGFRRGVGENFRDALDKELSLYRFELGTWAYQNRHVGCHPGVWSKIKFSHKVRYRIKAEVISFLLHYWAGVDSTSPPRSNGGKLSKVESLVDFG